MLYVQFSIDNNRYLVGTDQVVTLIPLVHMYSVDDAADWFAGCIDFRGERIPVIDVVKLYENRPARMRLSTRIIVVQLPRVAEYARKVGLLVERVAELVRLDEARFSALTSELQGIPGLDALANDDHGELRRVQARVLVADRTLVLTDCSKLTL